VCAPSAAPSAEQLRYLSGSAGSFKCAGLFECAACQEAQALLPSATQHMADAASQCPTDASIGDFHTGSMHTLQTLHTGGQPS